MIRFRCSKCKQKIGVSETAASKKVKCPKCGIIIVAPNPSQTETMFDKVFGQHDDSLDALFKEEPPDPFEKATIKFYCENCGTEYKRYANMAGKYITCAKCKNLVLVPGRSESHKIFKYEEQSRSAEPEPKIIEFCCENCGTVYRQSKNMAGRQIRCSECKNQMLVPLYNEPNSKLLRNKTTLDFKDDASLKLSETTKQCPFCKETIFETAKKCKHCGEFLDSSNYLAPFRQEIIRQPHSEERSKSSATRFLLGCVIIIVIVIPAVSIIVPAMQNAVDTIGNSVSATGNSDSPKESQQQDNSKAYKLRFFQAVQPFAEQLQKFSNRLSLGLDYDGFKNEVALLKDALDKIDYSSNDDKCRDVYKDAKQVVEDCTTTLSVWHNSIMEAQIYNYGFVPTVERDKALKKVTQSANSFSASYYILSNDLK